jgi:hypothetical protein
MCVICAQWQLHKLLFANCYDSICITVLRLTHWFALFLCLCDVCAMVSVLAAEHTGATDHTAVVVHSSATAGLSSCSTVSSITWGTRGNDAAADGSDNDDDASDAVSDDVNDDVATAIAKLNAAAVTAAGVDNADLPHHSAQQREHLERSDSGGAITAAKHKV